MNDSTMENHILQAIAERMLGHVGLSGRLVRMQSNTSPNEQVVAFEFTRATTSQPPEPPAPRKRYRVVPNDKCRRLVEEHTKELPEDADKLCMLCCDNEVDVELIHSEDKKGNGEEHKCKNNRFCKKCIGQAIAAQQTKSGTVIYPNCPCCKQRVCKMVPLTKSNVVLELPPFQQQSADSILRNANESKLWFAYNYEKKGQFAELTEWKVLAHSQHSKESHEHFIGRTNSWQSIYARSVMSSTRGSRIIGWPRPNDLLRHINIKLKEINQLDLSWLPKVYGGCLKVPKSKKKRKKPSASTAESSGAGSVGSTSTAERTTRVVRSNCQCPLCTSGRRQAPKKKRKKGSKTKKTE